jgi:hypothetical protein
MKLKVVTERGYKLTIEPNKDSEDGPITPNSKYKLIESLINLIMDGVDIRIKEYNIE